MVGFLEVRHVFHDGLSAYHGFTLAKVRKNITVSKDFPGSTPDYFSTFAQSVDLQYVTSVLRGSFQACFPRFASSVLSVRFKRAPGSLQACSPGIRFKRVENEPACRVKHHCRRLTLHRGAIAVESPRDCG